MSTKTSQKSKSRPLFGFLTPFVSQPTDQILWQSILDASEKLGADVICFSGGHIKDPNDYDAQRNILYDLVDQSSLDGLIIFGGAVCTNLSEDETVEFYDQFKPLPVVSISLALPGVPSIMIDNYAGQSEAISHLIENHGLKKLAYIKGKEGHSEASLRYQSYLDTLAKYDIPLDADLVVQGDFFPSSGYQGIRQLLDQRGVTFDGIIAANDHMAMGALEALSDRNILTPYDTVVVGFDDRPEASNTNPPLTTVRQSWAEMGRRAVEMIAAQLKGQEVPAETLLPPSLVIRQSCGCSNAEVRRASQWPDLSLSAVEPGGAGPIEIAAGDKRESTLDTLNQMVAHSGILFPEQATATLYEAFITALNENDPEIFIHAFSQALTKADYSNGDLGSLQGIVSILRTDVLAGLQDAQQLFEAERLIQQARVFVSEESRRIQAELQIKAAQQTQLLQDIGQSLNTASNNQELEAVIERDIGALGIEACYLSIYEDPDNPLEAARILLAHKAGQTTEIGPANESFASIDLAPKSILAPENRDRTIIEPLYFREQQLGFVLFEGPASISAYTNTLGDQLSSALRNVNIFAEMQTLLRRANALYEAGKNLVENLSFEEAIQTAVNGAVTGIAADMIGINVIDVNQKTVEYIKYGGPMAPETFEPAPFEELWEGLSGLAMRELTPVFSSKAMMPDPRESPKAQKRRQAFGAGSIIIVPMQYRGELLGTMTAINQIENPDFGRRDVDLMMALASQAAAAIMNARLFERMQASLALNERRATQLGTAAEVAQAISTILDIDELLPEVVEVIQERFHLYYCGLFLVDEDRKWAELRAGTGAPGRQMLEKAWKLELGGDSMVGRCASSGEADIQLDVDQAPIHLKNPYLPETRSEMALPLISRGETIGALSIQSSQARAFTPEDTSTLQTMANQLANAITNARLYGALAREQIYMDAIMENLPDAIYFKDQESRFLRVSKYMVEKYAADDESGLLGKTDFDLFTEDHARPALEDEKQIMETGQPLLNVEERETFADRADTWVLTSKLPLRNTQNQIVGTFGISRDISEQKINQVQLERQSNLLQTSAEVSQMVSEILDPDTLAWQIVEVIRQRLNLYYAGIFLVDESGEKATLEAGTGQTGKDMVSEEWQLEVGGASMIGRCISNGAADIQLNVDQAPIHLRNPHLPETKSEMALPLTSRGETIGALSIQSTQEDAFVPEDAATLQIMANQIASAIQNARLYEQNQAALAELQAAQRRYQQQAWSEFRQTQEKTGYRKEDADVIPLHKETLPEVRQAMSEKRPIVLKDENGKETVLTVPILLRDEPIGALGFNLPEDKSAWTQDDIAVAEAISEQFGLAAETLRLLDETQSRAARERLARQVTEQMQRATDIEDLIQNTMQELFTALSASQIVMHLGTEDELRTKLSE